MLIVEQAPNCQTLRVPVLKVFDGDGFLTKIESPRHPETAELTVRFGFIDAPEMGQLGGIEARDFLTSIIGGKSVDLAILTKMDTGGIVDSYGRIVAIPYLSGQSTPSSWFKQAALPRNIELEMVVNGWAWVLDRYCPDEIYNQALRDAQLHRRGIWARDDNIHPWEFKKQRYRAKRQTAVRPGQPTLFHELSLQDCCPSACGGIEVIRSGKFGNFVGCSNFPNCRHSRKISNPV
jgi:endonuclease YncB( thermonuclease family)